MGYNRASRSLFRGLGLLALCTGAIGCDSSPPAFVERVTPSGDDAIWSDDLQGEPQDQDGSSGEGKPQPTFLSAEWNFKATTLNQGLLEFDINQQVVHEYFSMSDITQEASIRHQQRERSLRTEVFGQGSEQQSASESFQQTENGSGVLDIVVVIDNSGSMREEQANLASKMMPLLSYVADSDWRIAVVTTDPGDGCLRALINKGDPNYAQAFSQAIRAGTSGSGNERGILQSVNALKMSCQNSQQWIRSNSTIAVLFVSDEDNCSNGFMCYGAAWESPQYLLNYLRDIRELGVNARVYGLIWHPSQDQRQCPTALHQGYAYAEAIDASEGQWGSICDNDYSATLSAISQDLSAILKSQFALQYPPYYSSVQVYVNGALQKNGYQVIGNVVEFEEPPPAGSAIKIDYEFTTDPPKKSFRLYGHPADGSVEVYLDGVASQSFHYDANQRIVSFDRAPMVREIKVVYRQGAQLEKNFLVEKFLDPAKIQVLVDAVLKDPSQYFYESSTGLIRFHEAPTDGATIEIRYDQILGPRLRYPAFVPEEVGDAFDVFDALTMMPMNFQLDGRDLVFAPADHLRGRRLMIRYNNPFADQRIIDLGWEAVAGSFRVWGTASGECERIRVIGTQLDLSNCGFNDSEHVWLEFAYIAEHVQEFVLDGADFELNESHQLEVTVNGKVSEDFQVNGKVLSFNQPLPLHAEVNVKLMSIRDQ